MFTRDEYNTMLTLSQGHLINLKMPKKIIKLFGHWTFKDIKDILLDKNDNFKKGVLPEADAPYMEMKRLHYYLLNTEYLDNPEIRNQEVKNWFIKIKMPGFIKNNLSHWTFKELKNILKSQTIDNLPGFLGIPYYKLDEHITYIDQERFLYHIQTISSVTYKPRVYIPCELWLSEIRTPKKIIETIGFMDMRELKDLIEIVETVILSEHKSDYIELRRLKHYIASLNR